MTNKVRNDFTIMSKCFCILISFIFSAGIKAQSDTSVYHEPYRPQIHFSPKEHWINDPNGMVYNDGVYHLFYQYYPDGTTWGPMHWGHATSADMINWTEQPVALFPDSLGYIFSGSSVADKNNTSGFSEGGKIPLVAIYTNHDPKGEKEGSKTFQNQSIAYSLDNGKTWTKYSGNPVVKNPGITGFRDPKVSWYEKDKKWIMTLATKDRITFYSSPNLKDWTKESEFGDKLGEHGGVWECPDLISFDYAGKKEWVLIVNINPGGPNGGSATQYFTGSFDGHRFTTDDTVTKWLDYGPDEYAGITWSNTGDRTIFLGWMSNWDYANEVPTGTWRGAMTIPRELSIVKVNDTFRIASMPAKELDKTATTIRSIPNLNRSNYTFTDNKKSNTPYRLMLSANATKDFSIVLSDSAGDKLIVGYDKKANQYYIDRTNAGKSNFKSGFASKAVAPHFYRSKKIELTLVIDAASIELFADKGLTTMTSIFFPHSLLNQITIQAKDKSLIQGLRIDKLTDIWK